MKICLSCNSLIADTFHKCTVCGNHDFKDYTGEHAPKNMGAITKPMGNNTKNRKVKRRRS